MSANSCLWLRYCVYAVLHTPRHGKAIRRRARALGSTFDWLPHGFINKWRAFVANWQIRKTTKLIAPQHDEQEEKEEGKEGGVGAEIEGGTCQLRCQQAELTLFSCEDVTKFFHILLQSLFLSLYLSFSPFSHPSLLLPLALDWHFQSAVAL